MIAIVPLGDHQFGEALYQLHRIAKFSALTRAAYSPSECPAAIPVNKPSSTRVPDGAATPTASNAGCAYNVLVSFLFSSGAR